MFSRKVVARLLVLLQYLEKKVYLKKTKTTPRSPEKRTNSSEATGAGRKETSLYSHSIPSAARSAGADADVRKPWSQLLEPSEGL